MRVKIPCDDGTGNILCLVQSDDGDIWVSVINKYGVGLKYSVRKRTSQGGGKHLETWFALQKVIEAAIKEGLEDRGVR